MSISTTLTKHSYAGNNSIVSPYPITFKYLDESHISVYFDGVLQTEGAGADYVMGGNGTTSTGYITTNVAQAGTVTVSIVLDVPLDQPVALLETGLLPAKTIEVEGFDRLNMQVRRVWRKLQDVLTFNTDEANGSTGTADNLIGFDGSGDIAEIPNSTFLQTANDLSDVDAATARTNLGVDAAGTDNSTDVTKTGAGTYISLAGQVLTVDAITESDVSDLGAYIENVTGSPLSELQDVTITTPISGQVISWNGSAWVNDVSGNGDALTSVGLDQFAATTSLQLKDTITDETGSGSLVFATSPALVTPALGIPTAIDLVNATNTPLPAAGTVTEVMLNTSANLSLDNADTSMQPTTYDPNTVAGDAFDSANHTYTPAGTGAVDTVVETKLREGVSVKDFGAVGNGVADDTAEIQAAIDSVSAAGGGTIYFPAGTYNINGATGIDVETGVNLKGDGMGKTIIKNVADNWRYIFGCRGGDDVGFEDLTIDGDWSTREPVDVDTDAKRGEGIIFWNGLSNLDRLRISNLEVKNTGHYGIGLQNVNIVSGIISNVYFENIGGDCIDIKSISSPLSGKALIIDGVFTSDGCGHNNTGHADTPATGHDNQAVVDVGGKVVLSNVFISGLDSYGAGADEQLGNVGVRFRAPVTSLNRLGSAGSVGSNIYVSSDKLDAEGTLTSKRVVGIAINDEDVSVTNAYVENCYWGIRAYDAEDGLPYRVNVTNATVKNCLGSTTDGIGFETVAASKKCVIDVIAEGCDTGAKINGTGHRARLTLDTNTTGLNVGNDALRQSNFDTKFVGNTTDSTNSYVDDETGLVVAKDLKVAALRTPDIDLLALANDGSWTSPDDRYMGRLRFLTADTSGSGAIARAQIAAKMTGDSGSSTFIEMGIDAGAGLVQGLLVLTDRVQSKLPHQLPSYTVSTLPAQITGATIYVSDASGGAVTAFSDGTNWRRTTDRTVIS